MTPGQCRALDHAICDRLVRLVRIHGTREAAGTSEYADLQYIQTALIEGSLSITEARP